MFVNDKNVRRWQCFVCGKQHDGYEEYRDHIIAEHEEGREYIICPACNAPVRDMSLHFKVKHPKRAMPKNVQHTVAVWRDFTLRGRKKEGVKQKAPKFRKGYFVSEKNGGKEFYYRSSYECQVYECLEEDMDVASYDAEPFKVSYYFEDKWHNYTPDLIITFTDGHKEIWEIKPASQTTLEKNKAKWSTMARQAKEAGVDFVVITEVGIGKLKNKVKKQRLINE